MAKTKNKIKYIDLASTKQIDRFVLPDLKERATNLLYQRFVKVVLKVGFKDLLLTDESTLDDFVPFGGKACLRFDDKVFVKRILDEYQIDISKMKHKYIWKILELISNKFCHIDAVLGYYPNLKDEYLETGKISDKSIIQQGPPIFKNDQEVDDLLNHIGDC